MKKRGILTTLVAVIFVAVMLAGCTGGSTATSWPGITASDGVYYISYHSYVYAINKDGNLKWRFPAAADSTKNFYGAPAVTGGKVIAGDYGNTLHALDASTGTEAWTFTQATGRWVAAPVVNGETILAACADTYLYALDLNGGLKWKFKTTHANWASPVTDGKTIWLASMDHNLYAIDFSSGKKVWALDMGAAVSGTPLYDDGKIYLGTLGNEFISVDAASGKVQWRVKLGGGIWSSPVKKDKDLFVGDYTGKFYSISLDGGKKNWELDAGAPITGSAAVLTDKLVFGNEKGEITALDFSGKKLWSRPLGGKIYSSLLWTGETLLTPSMETDTLLYAMDATGAQTWAFIPPK